MIWAWENSTPKFIAPTYLGSSSLHLITLFRNKRIWLNEMFQRNASKAMLTIFRARMWSFIMKWKTEKKYNMITVAFRLNISLSTNLLFMKSDYIALSHLSCHKVSERPHPLGLCFFGIWPLYIFRSFSQFEVLFVGWERLPHLIAQCV